MSISFPVPVRRVAAVFAFVIAGALLFLPASSHAQERGDALPRSSPNATVSQTVGVTDVEIGYSRPGVKGREVFGELVPYGEMWRTGANEATTISFSDSVRIEGQPLEAGTYGLFTIPGESEWTLVFNETADQWGAFEYDESQDALRVSVSPEEAAEQQERMTFHFPSATDSTAEVALAWDRTRVPFTIQTNTGANIRTRAEAAADTSSNWQAPYQYAAYALETDRYPEAALGWTERSIEMEENFQNTALKARLLAALERYDEARQEAERAMTMAEEMDETPQGMDELEQEMSSWPSSN